MQLLLGLKGSPLVGGTIPNVVTPEPARGSLLALVLDAVLLPGRQGEHREVLRSLVRRFTVEPFKEYGKNTFTGYK